MTSPTTETLCIVGASGYLGRYLVPLARQSWRTVGTYLTTQPAGDSAWRQLDVRDADAVAALIDALRPAVVIHLAFRRDDPDGNLLGARNLAEACAARGVRLVFVSTDAVFDGSRGWYRETDPPSPIEPYGASKVAGEREVLEHGGVVARSAVIYGFDPLDPWTASLVAEPLRQGRSSELFADEFRCPIYAPDLAAALLELAHGEFRGLIHLAGPQRLSRYEFGVRRANGLGLEPAGLVPIPLGDRARVRPPDCSLDNGLAREKLRTHLRSVDEVNTERG